MNKTTCLLTRQEFHDNATPLTCRIDDGDWTNANPKHFSTGSFGYCLTGKVLPEVGDCQVATQLGLNITAIGSKELPALPAPLPEKYPTGQYREDLSAQDNLPSKAYFLQHAKPVVVRLGNTVFSATARKFSSGAVGWNYSGKIDVDVNGTMVKCQVGLNLVVIGSQSLSEQGIPIADTPTEIKPQAPQPTTTPAGVNLKALAQQVRRMAEKNAEKPAPGKALEAALANVTSVAV